MLSLLGTVSCAGNKVPEVPASASSVRCMQDCVSVTKAFVKEHADLFDEAIRLRAALAICEKRR